MPCVFCDILAGDKPDHRVYEDETCVAFLDIYPIRPGHVLVVSKEHQQYVGDLPAGVSEQMFAVGARIGEALRHDDIGCDAVHFVLNDGRAANQTIPHVHLHVLPRRRGDFLRMLGRLALRPIQVALGPTSEKVLSHQATALRQRLDQ